MNKTARKTRFYIAVLLVFTFLLAIPLAANALTTTATWTVKIAAIDIQKDVSPGSQVPGGSVTYTIQVKNTGGADLYDVTVTDPMLGIDHQNIGDLAAGASAAPITKNYTIPNSAMPGSTIVNTAEVIGYYGQYLALSKGDGPPPTYERPYVSDSDQASVRVSSPGGGQTPGGGETPAGGDNGITTESVTVPGEAPVATPQRPPVQQPQPEPVVVPVEQPVAAPKGDLPKTGGNMLWLVLSGLGLATAGMTIRRRKK